MTLRRRRSTAWAVAALTLIPTTVAGCASDDDPPAALDQVAPTRADVARDAGVDFPESTAGFRLVRLGPNQIDVTFTVSPDDVESFASGTGVELTAGERAITHASPLWDVAVTAPLRGGSSTRNGIRRDVEVVDGGAIATVRLSLLLDP